MKKLLLASLVSTLLVGCGGSDDNGGNTIVPPAPVAPTTPCEEGMDCMDEGFTNPSLPLFPLEPSKPITPPTEHCPDGSCLEDDGFSVDERTRVIREIAKMSNWDESYIDGLCQNGKYDETIFWVNTCTLIDGGFEILRHSRNSSEHTIGSIYRPLHGEFLVKTKLYSFFPKPDTVELSNAIGWTNTMSNVILQVTDVDAEIVGRDIKVNATVKLSANDVDALLTDEFNINGVGFNIRATVKETFGNLENIKEAEVLHNDAIVSQQTHEQKQFWEFYKHCTIIGVQK